MDGFFILQKRQQTHLLIESKNAERIIDATWPPQMEFREYRANIHIETKKESLWMTTVWEAYESDERTFNPASPLIESKKAYG
jgi:hypothetical protein